MSDTDNKIEIFRDALGGYDGLKSYTYLTWKPPSWAVPGVTIYIFHITGGLESSGSWQETIDIHKTILSDTSFHINPETTKNNYIYALIPKGLSYHLEVCATNSAIGGDPFLWDVSKILAKDYKAPNIGE